MSYWLVKEEPTHYSFEDLARDGRTEWAGVHNALALRHLRAMVPDDELFYYHTGTERSIVGIARVSRGPKPDLSDARGSWSVEVEALTVLPRPVTLTEMRDDPALTGLDLLRVGRLSILPVSTAHWARILERARGAAPITRSRPSPTRSAGARSTRRTARRRAKRASASGAGPRRSARRSGRGKGS